MGLWYLSGRTRGVTVPSGSLENCQTGLKSFIAQDPWRSLSGHSLGLKRCFAFRALSLYKPTLLPLIFFFYFFVEIFYQSTSVILARQTKPSSYFTYPCSSSPSVLLFWWVFLSFHLKSFFSLHFKICITVVHYRHIRVLGLTITCRSCLMRQVTSHLSVTGRATRKCTHQVTKTMIVPVKRGACLLLLPPQGIRVWRWVMKRVLMTNQTMMTSKFSLLWVLMDLGSSSCYLSGQ